MSKWIIRNVRADLSKITKTYNISETLATVLINRNITNSRKLDTYLFETENLFHDVLKMKDVKESYEKLANAISNKDKICIYGDYDVDGVTSTTILYKGLKNINANVIYYIPNREEEGYGLNMEAIKEVSEKNVDLILTCDNGIASIEEIKYIKDIGLDIIVLDHHEPRFFEYENERKEVLPVADYIVNPKQSACPYEFKELCAGGISFKFIKGLYEYLEIEMNTDEYLVLASIATVCDIVDLIDENRILTKLGLKLLNNNKKINLGLYYLLKKSEIEDKCLDEYDYGFAIGPRINASGRLETALKAVELFTSDDIDKIEELSSELVELNTERRKLTADAVSRITSKLAESDISNERVLVIYDDEIHESIAGIVAGRIKEMLFKPTIVLTNAKSGAKGSARSIPAYNIFEELLKCQHILDKFGGHKMAAGLSLSIDRIDELRSTLNQNCTLTNDELIQEIVIDKPLKFSDITMNLANELSKMKPLGKENRGAIFATKNVAIKNIRFVGKENNIIQLVLEDETKKELKAISFSGYENLMNIFSKNLPKEEVKKILTGIKKDVALKLDVLYTIEVNEFNNNRNVQLILNDFRIAK